jgi:glycogen phosphorylase
MEFLIERSLSNNISNMLLDPVKRAVAQRDVDWLGLIEEEPDAGLGNSGLGRLAACFLDSMATMQLPTMGYGLRYEYGIFKQSIRDGWQVKWKNRTTGCATRAPGRLLGQLIAWK